MNLSNAQSNELRMPTAHIVGIRSLVLFLLAASVLTNAEADPRKLQTTYATVPELCQKFIDAYSSFTACPLTDDQCFVYRWEGGTDSELTKITAQELAVNQYGYTRVHVAHPPGKPYSLVYLDRFEGDRHPRLLETWKVDTVALEIVTERDPHPLPYEQWVKGNHQISRDSLAPEFANVLSEGQKISDDWSPVWMPLFQHNAADYAVTRECAGTWVYGGYYACNVITKVIVKRLSADKKTLPVCEFTRPSDR